MSLTSCRLCDKIADHNMKHYSQTVFMRQYIRSMFDVTHPLISISSDPAPTIWWQWLTCVSLSCSLIIWTMIDLVFMWTLECYLPPSEHLWVFAIPYEDHLPPCPPIAIWIFLCWCAVWQKCIPKNVEILKKLWQQHHPISKIEQVILGHVWTI